MNGQYDREIVTMKKGIIFDVDGTLWDAAVQVADSWNVVLEKHPEIHRRITVQDMYNNMGKTMAEFGAALFPELPPADSGKLMEECMSYENQYLLVHPGVLYPEVKETLQELSRRYGLYIVSNCQCGYIEVLLRSHGLETCILDTECFGSTKLPKGDNIHMVIERNHLDQCFYVGDTAMDQAAASAAGIPFVHASYGYGEAEEAAGRLDSMSQLPVLAERLLDKR